MVKFVSSKKMLRNTEEFNHKGTYKTVFHGTSVNVICYMAQQRNIAVTLLLPSDFTDFMVFFFGEILLTGDPRVTNASTHERVRSTFQQSLYRQGKRGGWG